MVSQSDMVFFAIGTLLAENPGASVRTFRVFSVKYGGILLHYCQSCVPKIALPNLDAVQPVAIVEFKPFVCNSRVFTLGLSKQMFDLCAYVGQCPDCGTIYLLNEHINLPEE